MNKKNILTYTEVNNLINAHMVAIRLVKGEKVALETEISYKSGHFFIRPPGCSPDYLAVPLRPWELEDMTKELLK
jgi:hypothetical protein